MADDADNPMSVSSDYSAMASYWAMVNAILCGAEALRAASRTGSVPGPHVPYANLAQLDRRNGGVQSPYLPQFPNETSADYETRRRNAPLTNIYADISANLSAKPFSKTLELDETTPEDLKKLAENIDGQGNNLHVYSRDVFKSGLDKGIHWILVDYPKMPSGATLADERQSGAKPYWVHIHAERMLAAYSVFFGGREIITHARIYEPSTRRSGFQEEQVNRVRVLDREEIRDGLNVLRGLGPATWQLWEEVSSGEGTAKKTEWQLVDSGAITLGEIPLVFYITGKRHGTSFQVDPPLKDLAYMQIEEFQQESNLKSIKELTAFPMLVAENISLQDKDGGEIVVPVGPRAVLGAPPTEKANATWKFIEPAGSSLTFLQSDLEKIRTEMRNLGMQPLATANLTVVTTANVSMKAHSAVQAWAIGLKDALEQAWILTCKWLGQKLEPEVKVFTDFGVDLEAGTELGEISKAPWLSDYDKFEEFKRRGVLRDSADWDENQERLAEQQQGLQPETAIDPVTGEPIPIDPLTGKPLAQPSPPPTVN